MTFFNCIQKYYGSEYDYNCAETGLYAANEAYRLNLSPDALKAMAAFGGGMSVDRVCGAISSALVALSILFVQERAHESEKIKTLVGEFYKGFLDEFGTDQCSELKPVYHDEESRCSKIFRVSTRILDEVIEKERNPMIEEADALA
ncbi:MAG: C-GCAxxG-C-C family (seleno)protein [Peptostreptococcales bacterium]